MKLDGFKEFLQERKLDLDKTAAAVNIVNTFSDHLAKHKKTIENASYDDFQNFSTYLIKNNENLFDNYVNLYRFGYFKKNDQLIIASMEVIDGGEVIANFSKRLEEEFGEEVRNEIFGGLSSNMNIYPVLGTSLFPTLSIALV